MGSGACKLQASSFPGRKYRSRPRIYLAGDRGFWISYFYSRLFQTSARRKKCFGMTGILESKAASPRSTKFLPPEKTARTWISGLSSATTWHYSTRNTLQLYLAHFPASIIQPTAAWKPQGGPIRFAIAKANANSYSEQPFLEM